MEWNPKRQVWLKASRIPTGDIPHPSKDDKVTNKQVTVFLWTFFLSYQTIYFLALVCLLCHGLCVGHVMPCSCQWDLATSVLLKSQRVGAVGIFPLLPGVQVCHVLSCWSCHIKHALLMQFFQLLCFQNNTFIFGYFLRLSISVFACVRMRSRPYTHETSGNQLEI